MANILYLKASPRGDRSYSVAVADAFIDVYHKAHPNDQVTTLDVFYDDLPAFDFEAATAKYKVIHGKNHTAEDKKVWSAIVSVIDEFKAADKYVMAIPMWNFLIPYRLKQYIDILVQPGYTFTVDDNGNYHGLVTGKPVFIAYSRGGTYPAGTEMAAFDFQTKYMKFILGYIGLTDIRSVAVEPTLGQGPEAAAEAKADAITKAKEMARDF